MSYAGDRLICDADSHLMELDDFLLEFCPASDRALLGDLGAVLSGQFAPGAYTRASGHDAHTVEQQLALGDAITRGPKWHAALGAFNGREGHRYSI